YIDNFFRKYLYFIKAFINNMVIFSEIKKEYFKYLEIVFKLFIKKNLMIFPIKSFFRYPIIKLLGFRVDFFGLFNIEFYIKAFQDLAFLF
ncbi:hypothetical protein V8F20_012857, partial [Naviculisporaceae sp. PSN 640]